MDELHTVYDNLEIRQEDYEKIETDAGKSSLDSWNTAKKVLEKWSAKSGSKATRQKILDALTECGDKEAMEILKDRWTKNGNFVNVIVFNT